MGSNKCAGHTLNRHLKDCFLYAQKGSQMYQNMLPSWVPQALHHQCFGICSRDAMSAPKNDCQKHHWLCRNQETTVIPVNTISQSWDPCPLADRQHQLRLLHSVPGTQAPIVAANCGKAPTQIAEFLFEIIWATCLVMAAHQMEQSRTFVPIQRLWQIIASFYVSQQHCIVHKTNWSNSISIHSSMGTRILEELLHLHLHSAVHLFGAFTPAPCL